MRKNITEKAFLDDCIFYMVEIVNWYVNFDILKQPIKYLYLYMYTLWKAAKEFVFNIHVVVFLSYL